MGSHFTSTACVLLFLASVSPPVSSISLYDISMAASSQVNRSSETNYSSENAVTQATATKSMVTFPTFSQTGKPRIFSPLIHHLSSLLRGKSMQQTFSDDPRAQNNSVISENSTSSARDMFGSTLNHARLASMRIAEVRHRLEQLRVLSSDTGVISGESDGYRWSRLSSGDANLKPIFRPENRRHSSRSQRTIQTVVLYPRCDSESAAPWLRGTLTHNVVFDFEQLINFTKVVTASLDINYAGNGNETAIDDRMVMLVSLNKRFQGKRVEEILSYDYLDSYAPANISLDILQPVKRWIRNPLKNRGLSIQLRSSLGVAQPLEEYLQIPTDCLSERGQSERRLTGSYNSDYSHDKSSESAIQPSNRTKAVILPHRNHNVVARNSSVNRTYPRDVTYDSQPAEINQTLDSLEITPQSSEITDRNEKIVSSISLTLQLATTSSSSHDSSLSSQESSGDYSTGS